MLIIFFFDDFDDIDKTFVQNIVLNKFRFENYIVLIVIFSNIFVTLLNENQIAHIRFKISLNLTIENTYNIKKKNRWRQFDQTNQIDILKRIVDTT